MIISDVLKSPTDKTIRITQYSVNLESTAKPVAMIVIDFFGSTLKGSSEGDGGFDALMKAITKALSSESLVLPNLSDFRVRIPPGGKTEALVETLIKWDTQDISRTFVTNGVDTDQLGAAVIAVEKMLNIMGSLNAQHK
jgi:D-citramalate synthase